MDRETLRAMVWAAAFADEAGMFNPIKVDTDRAEASARNANIAVRTFDTLPDAHLPLNKPVDEEGK